MSAINNLPLDIIEAILRRLPAKSLCRFKSVSKPWLSLISDPQFIKTHLHLNNHHSASKLIVVSDTNSLYSLDLNEIAPHANSDDVAATGNALMFRPPSIRWDSILGSCNGLVLAMDKQLTLYLMNPTTREIRNLFPFSISKQYHYDMYGFGYDSSTDDYKVIAISRWTAENYIPELCSINVYTLKNNTWRSLEYRTPDNRVFFNYGSGVLVNGSLHWLTNTKCKSSYKILAFSLANEELKELEIPDMFNSYTGTFCDLGVIGGKLSIYHELFGCVLVMEEYGVGMSWTQFPFLGAKKREPLKPICKVEDNNGDIVLHDEDGDVFLYNVDARACRKVRIQGGPTKFTIGGTYIESLVSPKSIT